MPHRTLIALTLFTLMLAVLPVLAEDVANTNHGIDLNEAQAIALAQYPDAAVVAMERTTEDGVHAWDIMLDNGMAVYVNAQTGAIIELEPWRGSWVRPAGSQFIAPLINAAPIEIGTDGVDIEEARRIALSFYPNAAVVELDLERENGVNAWDVMLDNGMAVYIHAGSGAVIEFESWNSPLRDRDWEGGTPPWAGFPGGRRAWEAQRGMPSNVDTPVGAISTDEAIAIALTQFPGARVIEVKPNTDSGVRVWDIELSNGVTLDISMADGSIVDIWSGDQDWDDD